MKNAKCVSCEKPFDLEAEGDIVEIKNDYYDKAVCQDCLGDDLSEPLAKVMLASDSDKYVGSIGHYGFEVEDFGGYNSGTRFWNLVHEYANKLRWKASDAWRGFYEGQALEGWGRVIDSWFGSADGYFPEEAIEKFHFKWEVKQDFPDFEVLVAFPRTSNVCSTGIEVYVPKGEEKQFHQWLGGK